MHGLLQWGPAHTTPTSAHRRFVLIESERATETEMSMAAQKRWQRRWKQNVRAFVCVCVCDWELVGVRVCVCVRLIEFIIIIIIMNLM